MGERDACDCGSLLLPLLEKWRARFVALLFAKFTNPCSICVAAPWAACITESAPRSVYTLGQFGIRCCRLRLFVDRHGLLGAFHDWLDIAFG